MPLEERPSLPRRLVLLLVTALVQALLVLGLQWVLPGFHLRGPLNGYAGALILVVLLTMAWPVVFGIASFFTAWLFPILIFFFSGVVVTAIAWIGTLSDHPWIKIDDIGTGIWLTVWLVIANTVLAVVFSLDDEGAYNLTVTRPLRRRYRHVKKMSEPGTMFLEIDGLSRPILEQALANGHMPHLKRWIDEGRYTITSWETDFSSQTSASQAGILLGDNTGIPAFRWWDKPSKALMVSSKMATAHHLEGQLSTGDGLLVDGGGSRWNVFSGDALDTLCTFSTLDDFKRQPSNTYLALFFNPFTFLRALTLFLVDIVRERWQARQQRVHNVLPRIHRTWTYALTRAATTSLMQEASRYFIAADMLRGVPSTYTTLFGYDEVAHHSGIDRPDVWGVLKRLDRDFRYLAMIAGNAARPYRLVILSDHGQSMGATFLQRYGKSLAQVVGEVMDPASKVTQVSAGDEGQGYVNVALQQVMNQGTRSGKLMERILSDKKENGELSIGKDAIVAGADKASADSDAVVLASGNLGIISFPKIEGRASWETIAKVHPNVVKTLIEHPGVSYVLINTDEFGPVALGKDAIHYLRDDVVEGGESPLAKFGPNARDHALREAMFPNCPDILVISMFDPETNEVAAFEELVGNHGGMGGWQTHPFILHPVELTVPDEPIVGTKAIHTVMKGWVRSDHPLAAARPA